MMTALSTATLRLRLRFNSERLKEKPSLDREVEVVPAQGPADPSRPQ